MNVILLTLINHQIISFWRQFVSMFGGFWRHHDPTLTEHEDSLFFSELLQESCQMAAVEIIRRIIGVAHVEDFESIQEPSTRFSLPHTLTNTQSLSV